MPGLFICWLYNVEEPRGKYVTSFFLQRAMFQALSGEDIVLTNTRGIERHHLTCRQRGNGADQKPTSGDASPAGFARYEHIEATDGGIVGLFNPQERGETVSTQFGRNDHDASLRISSVE